MLAYGETGSGKTYTMYALIENFLASMSNYTSETVTKVSMKLSAIEISLIEGREHMYDLLNKRQ